MSKREMRTFDVYRFYDPEIARCVDPVTAGQYAETREAELLELPEDARPMLFRCRALTRQQRDRLQEVSTPKTQLKMAFRFGITEIRNIPLANGELTAWVPQRKRANDQIDDAALDALDDLGIGDVDIWEIGGVVVAQSFLAHGAPVYCPQQPSSQLAWVAVRSRFHAEQKQEDETRKEG